MSWLGNILPFAQDSIGEIGKHPWQAAGAALGVPGFDPTIGGLFNNRPGGALLSPTGNFTSSAWNDMYQNNPGDTGALNMFHRINSVADVVAPMVAGGFASGALGGAGSAGGSSSGGMGGLGSLFGHSTTLGPSGIGGSGSLFGAGAGMGGGALPGTAAPAMASSGPFAGAFGGAAMQYPFSMGAGASSFNPQMLQQAMSMMQQNQNQQPQQPGAMPPMPAEFGNAPVHGAPIGPAMPYSTFGASGAQTMSPLAQMLAMRGGM